MTSHSHRSALGILAALALAVPVSAQEVALKGGLAVSRFQATAVPYDGSYISTSFGVHARFGLGRIAIQPELQMVSRGASIDGAPDDQQLRLDYMELPLMLVVPVRTGRFEPYAFGGPVLSVETRCRSIIEQEGLRTNFGCDDPSAPDSFDRPVFDYGVGAGAGVSYPIGRGRVLVEGRYTWGLRNIYNGSIQGAEVRNRSAVFSIGYAIQPDAFEG